MNNVKQKKHMVRTIGAALAAAALLGSCTIGLSPDTQGPEADLAELDAQLSVTANSAVAAADAQLSASGGIGASTTYNNPGMDPVAVVGQGTVDLPARSNYPYPGWTTTGTVEQVSPDAGWTTSVGSGNNVFQVTAIATPDQADVYPESEVREVYYVIDTTGSYGDSVGGGDDSIFDPYGLAGSGYRDEYVANYADGSTRDHWIISTGTQYAPFDINGSLDLETLAAEQVATDNAAVYSSATMYTHELGETFNYWFWNNSDQVTPYTIGVRYYTEHVVDGEYVGTSMTFEYTYDSSWQTGDTTPTLLARTVIREEMRFAYDAGNDEVGDATGHTLRLRTEVNNTSGGEGLVYTRQGKSLTDWNSRGNAREAQLSGVQRDTLPAGYGDIADFSAVIDEVTGTTE